MHQNHFSGRTAVITGSVFAVGLQTAERIATKATMSRCGIRGKFGNRRMTAFGVKADIQLNGAEWLLLTQSGHWI